MFLKRKLMRCSYWAILSLMLLFSSVSQLTQAGWWESFSSAVARASTTGLQRLQERPWLTAGLLGGAAAIAYAGYRYYRQSNNALIAAAIRGDTDTVSQLLAMPDINVNQVNRAGSTALMFAADQGHTAVVSQLLTRPDIDVNQADQQGMTALMFAALWGHAAVVMQLLTKPGIDVNQASGWDSYSRTALMCAADHGRVTVVAQLLARPDIDVNQADMYGYTALMIAAERGNATLTSQLLARPDINVNSFSEGGWTALQFAALRGHAVVVAQLLATPDISVHQNGAWLLAADGCHTAVVAQLLTSNVIVPTEAYFENHPTFQAAKVDLAARNTAFIAAATAGQLATMHQLLAQGLYDKTNVLNQALVAATGAELELSDCVTVLQLLLAQGADLNAIVLPTVTDSGKEYVTPRNRSALVQRLLTWGAALRNAIMPTSDEADGGVAESKTDDAITAPSTATIMPRTALEAAILSNHPALVRLLLSWGAVPNLAPAVLEYVGLFTPRSDLAGSVARAEVLTAATTAGWTSAAVEQALEIALLLREVHVQHGDPSSLHAMQRK